MSIKLISEVLTYLSSDSCHLTPAERLTLMAIAERARDDTRQAWQGGTDDWSLSRIVGVRDLRDVLERLTRRDLDVRVAIRTDSRGRPVYAHRGNQVTYRLPRIPGFVAPADDPATSETADVEETTGPALSTGILEGEAGTAPKGQEGAVPARKGAVPARKGAVPARKGAVPARKGAVGTAPYPSSTLSTPHQPSSTRETTVDPWATIGATDEEKEIIIERIRKANPAISNLGGYIAAMHHNGDLIDLLTTLRDAAAAATLKAVLAAARRGPMCEHLVAGGATHHPATGSPLCPLCRTAHQNHRKPAPSSCPSTDLPIVDALLDSASAEITPPGRPARPGIGICVECSEFGSFTLAEDALTGSHCRMHSRKVAAL